MALAPPRRYGACRVTLTDTARRAWKQHWPLTLIVLGASGLLFANLGADALWEDEGDTAVLARTILRHGVPIAWDGVTFLDPDYGQRLNFGFVMVSHPWLQYYLTALSFGLLGESAGAARLPFAIAGVLTIAVVYMMGAVLLRNRTVGVSAAVLLMLSVQFLLFSRQARNYPVHALLTCVLLWQFVRLRSWRGSLLFCATGVALFHAHPLGIATVAALAATTLICGECRALRRWVWPPAVAVALYAAPWLLLSRAGHAEAATAIDGIRDVVWRLGQFAIEYASVVPALGILALALWHRRRREVFSPDERRLAAGSAAILAAATVATVVTQTPVDIWILGLHHTPALIPVTVLIAALLIQKVSGQHRVAVVVMVAVLGFTRLGQLVPWVSWAEPVAEAREEAATFHVPPRVTDRLLRTTQVQFARSLVQPNPGVMTHVAQFLRRHASASDVVLTNAESQALYFHTGLPQAAKIAPSFPIYREARARGLPEYVFGYEGLRWIVWRRAFPAYFPEQDVAKLLRHFAVIGIRTELVATFPETIFENRENVFFRRYPGGVYVYPWHEHVPVVHVYRVHWPSGPERSYVQGNTHFAAQEFAAAIAEYERFVAARPTHADGQARLGISYVLVGRTGDGVRALRRAVALAPNDGSIALNLANALYEERQIGEAEHFARRATALRPEDPLAYEVLARAVALQGRVAEGIGHFERALQLDPGFEAARDNLRQLRQLSGR